MLNTWATPGTTTIPYANLTADAQAAPIVTAIENVRARQSVLLALDLCHAHIRTTAINWSAGQGLGATLVGSFDEKRPWIRSSHSGAPIDPNLPQGPYDSTLAAGAPGGPPAASAVAGMIAGPANWDWLVNSTTPHTNAANPNLVASYFEITLGHVPGVDGGRLVFDPFNTTWFVSEHYAVQYRITGVPAPAAGDPAGTRVTNAAALVTIPGVHVGQGSATQFMKQLWAKMRDAEF